MDVLEFLMRANEHLCPHFLKHIILCVCLSEMQAKPLVLCCVVCSAVINPNKWQHVVHIAILSSLCRYEDKCVHPPNLSISVGGEKAIMIAF